MRTDLRGTLLGLRRELQTDVESLRGLEAVEQEAGTLDELLLDLDRQLERVRSAAVITLVGATGAGKSTLLNALAGEEIAKEGVDRPTTTAPVIFRPRDADVRELVRDLPGEAPTIVDYEPDSAGPWRGQILIDAPDVNSVASAHREVVGALAARSDVLVVACHRQSIAELSSVAFVDTFAARRELLFVLGRADELSANARETLLEQIRDLARERWGQSDPRVVAVSARKARLGEEDEGWRALLANLDELVIGGRLGGVRRHNALGTARNLGEHFAGLSAKGLGQELDSVTAALTRGLDGWRARVEATMNERLELRRADLNALLWNESARRWDGPGGWALRVGGLSAMGLGAGAALARRNPLIAAGAAVGGMMADKARDGIRERNLRDGAGLLPTTSEMAEAWRAELGEARLATERLGAVAVPEPEELGARAATAAEEAWGKLMATDLPQAAESSLAPAIRWTIDAPVYALGAWVVIEAGRGLFTTNYVGLDLLVNGAIVLLAWLFLARVVCRRLLAQRGERLLAAVREHAGRELAEAARGAGAAVGEDLAGRSASLNRLVEVETRWRDRLVPPGETSA